MVEMKQKIHDSKILNDANKLSAHFYHRPFMLVTGAHPSLLITVILLSELTNSLLVELRCIAVFWVRLLSVMKQ